MKDNYKFVFLIISIILGLAIGLFIFNSILDIQQGIQACKDAGYLGIQFTNKYTLDYKCGEMTEELTQKINEVVGR